MIRNKDAVLEAVSAGDGGAAGCSDVALDTTDEAKILLEISIRIGDLDSGIPASRSSVV